jgi:hypothetical protein
MTLPKGQVWLLKEGGVPLLEGRSQNQRGCVRAGYRLHVHLGGDQTAPDSIGSAGSAAHSERLPS